MLNRYNFHVKHGAAWKAGLGLHAEDKQFLVYKHVIAILVI